MLNTKTQGSSSREDFKWYLFIILLKTSFASVINMYTFLLKILESLKRDVGYFKQLIFSQNLTNGKKSILMLGHYFC